MTKSLYPDAQDGIFTIVSKVSQTEETSYYKGKYPPEYLG